MRVSTILSTLALAAVSVLAAPSKTPACDPGSHNTGILLPNAGQTLTAGEEFQFYFCSDAYFKISTVQIHVGFEDPDHPDPVASNLIAVSLQPDPDSGYRTALSFTGGDVDSGKRTLIVYEVQTGYENQYNYVKTRIPVNIA